MGDPRMRAPILLGGEDTMDVDEAMPSVLPTNAVAESKELISSIITPSPYPHHNAVGSRFRNALTRVETKPEIDVEAWQALLTEVNSCYRMLYVHAVDADTQAKLDWAESIYGCLLKHFPYAAIHVHAIGEMLYAQSARIGEEGGPMIDTGMETSKRALRCEAKLDALLGRMLGGSGDDGGNTEKSPVVGLCSWSVDLWLLYVRKSVRDATRHADLQPMDERARHVREATKAAYDRAVHHAGAAVRNHEIWKAYVNYIKSWDVAMDHQLAQQQMLDLRALFKRLVVNPMTGLDQLWQEYEAFERSQNEALAQALIAEMAPKYQHARTVYLERNRVYISDTLQLGRLATPPAEHDDEDYGSKMEEEYKLLNLWKTRCAYERTNPERLGPPELSARIRQHFKEMVCVLTRHPESWHMWSTWELLASSEGQKLDRAVQVLHLGQTHIPDCTLLAFAEAQMVERHAENPEKSMVVLEQFLERSPNTLGFVLYQKMVRRYKGIDDARNVFARARRTLIEGASTQLEEKVSEKNEEVAEGETAVKKEEIDVSKRLIVTNRLDPSITGQVMEQQIRNLAKNEDNNEAEMNPSARPPGVITWHLYASHALIEHRVNRLPEIAARIYELGLRKNASFLTKPAYIMRYAQLLLELGDTVNLRALLTRSVSACEAEKVKSSVAAIWDMNMYFESLMCDGDASSVSRLKVIEAKRREALMGPDIEDVATGGVIGSIESALIGAQKSTIGDQLVRTEGYELSSNIVNGLSRTVEMFAVMGLWGDDSSGTFRSASAASEKGSDLPGGKSDASFRNRLLFMKMIASGESGDVLGEGPLGSKILSARERLQQGSSLQAGAGGQSSAIMLAIQQSPDWLRPLLLLLPASRLRLPIVAKPPPHLVELCLNALKINPLPAERPTDENNTAEKRKREDQEDSDDENGGISGGYDSQFRSRQRVKQQLVE